VVGGSLDQTFARLVQGGIGHMCVCGHHCKSSSGTHVSCVLQSVFLWFQVIEHNSCAYAFFDSSRDRLIPSGSHGRWWESY